MDVDDDVGCLVFHARARERERGRRAEARREAMALGDGWR